MTMTDTRQDPYSALGVPRAATTAEITHAYRAQLRANHPDTRPTGPRGADPQADDRLRHVIAAYALLRDAERRTAYDRAHPVTPPISAPAAPSTSQSYIREKNGPPLRASPVYWRPA